jgi:ribosomal protein L35
MKRNKVVKMKSRKSLVKRFRVTPTGKVLFRGSHVRHLRRHKTKAGLRRQKIPHQIQKAWAVKIKNALGVKK